MSEFKHEVGVIAPNFLLNLLLVKMSEKSLTKADFRSKNPKDMSNGGTPLLLLKPVCKFEALLGASFIKIKLQVLLRPGTPVL